MEGQLSEYLSRVIESTLRTTNNLLERLHASFFFYILTSPERFVQIGNFLPSVVLISVAMMFGGLKYWVQAGWELKQHKGKGLAQETQWMTRTRPVLPVLTVMLLSHALGVLLLRVLTSHWFNSGNTVRSLLQIAGPTLISSSYALSVYSWPLVAYLLHSGPGFLDHHDMGRQHQLCSKPSTFATRRQ